MIRLDQRNADVQGTERVFKKVVHGGHNALRFVDKNGLPMRPPNTATLSRLHSTYVLSPRGVPTRKSNHSYSGQLTQDKMQNMVNSLETSSQEMASYASMHSYGNGLSSAGSSRHYLSTANSQKHRTFGPARSAKTMNKSASSQRTHRMLVSAPELEITNNDPNQEATNDSPQGKRLGKEWSALSQCRALKRSSEIVSHRVDRMYFMSGNKLKLQAKYHVEEDDLQQLRELQAARASSRSSRDEMRKRAQSMMKQKDSNEKERLDKIERKLSSIEHRLNHIEERSESRIKDMVSGPRSVHINEVIDFIDVSSSTSSESGIHEEDEDQDIEDEDFIAREMSKRNAEKEEETEVLDDVSVIGERPVSRVEIRPLSGHRNPSAGIQLLDILSHDKGSGYADTMLKLFEVHPNTNLRPQLLPRHGVNYKDANELTLGVPRKVRAKIKSTPKRVEITPQLEKELIGNAINPICRFCKCQKKSSKPLDIGGAIDNNKDNLKQRFPTRKPNIKISHHPRVQCDCRLDPRRSKGPLLTVTGRQVPLRDRDILYAIA